MLWLHQGKIKIRVDSNEFTRKHHGGVNMFYRGVLLFAFVLFSKAVSFADFGVEPQFMPNPMLRTCQINNGNSILIHIDDDQVLLCQIGSSIIGSLELFLYKSEGQPAQNIKILLSHDTRPSQCYKARTLNDEEGRVFELCLFEDGSMIDKSTLLKGLEHTENTQLKRILNEKI